VVLDTIDSYLKGGFDYLIETGMINVVYSISLIPVAVAGIWSEKIRFHNFVSVLYFVWQSLIYFDMYTVLAF
jgi:hypothetical membrane protein